MKLDRYSPKNLKRASKGMININPIQRGGILTPEAREILSDWADGYSVCDLCIKGRVDLLENPPIYEFKKDVAEFLNMDDVRFTAGARHAKYAVMSFFRGKTIVLDSLAHYTSYIAAEFNELKIYEVPNSGYPEFRIEAEKYAETFEKVRELTGNYPDLALLTHVDYRFGNMSDAKKVGKICEEYGIPLILNTAYTSGIMEIDGKKLNADFLVASCHKNWAATAPIGILALREDFSEKILKKSEVEGIDGRKFSRKELAIFGCSPVYGLPIVTLMASFPRVVERVKRWDEEIRKARWIAEELEKIEGIKLLGERPKKHTLMQFESKSFYEISKKHKKRGFLIYHELKKRGIFGVQPGITKNFKINVYGLSWEELEKVADAFKDIARKYGVSVEE